MRITVAFFVAASIASLGGCGEIKRMDAEARAAQRADDQATCTQYGYQPGSDAFADCMMHRDSERARQRAMADQAEKQRKWEAEQSARRADAAKQDATPHTAIPDPGSMDCTSTESVTSSGSGGANAGTSSTTTRTTTHCHSH